MPGVSGKIDPAHIDGPGAAAGNVLTWDGGKAKWSPGGGGILGYAEVSYEFPTDIPADDHYVDATAVTIDASYGDPALAASGNEITYSVGDAVGLYVVTAQVKLAPSVDAVPHNLVATDGTFTFTILEPILETADVTMVGRLAYPPQGTIARTLRLDYEYAIAPSCKWRNTVDTSGVLDVQYCRLSIIRFASP